MIIDVTSASHNDLVDTFNAIRNELERRTPSLLGKIVHVPDHLLHEDTPVSRKTAKITRVNATGRRNGFHTLSIAPGGAYASCSGIYPWELKLVNEKREG